MQSPELVRPVALRCNDLAKPAQVKRLKQTPLPGFSPSTLGVAVDSCRTESNRQSHARSRKRKQRAEQCYGLAVGEALNQRARSIPSDSQSAVALQLSKQGATAALDYGCFL